MEAIDFMNNCLYEKNPGTVENLVSHPKIIIIKKDGTILFSDRTNDDKNISVFGNNKVCNNHVDYMQVLIEKYFSDNKDMVDSAKREDLYSNLLQLVDNGNIVFNNVTTYDGPTFYINGIHGALLIPNNYTEEQEKSLGAINDYINYFKNIEVVEYNIEHSAENTKEVNMVYYEPGDVAINNYLNKKNEKNKTRV